jgi:hypothetical protein
VGKSVIRSHRGGRPVISMFHTSLVIYSQAAAVTHSDTSQVDRT